MSGLHWLGPAGRKLSGFRLTEKFVLLLVFSGFITLCFGAIFFLPDSPKLLSGVFFQQPPPQRTPLGTGLQDEEDGGRLARIREEHERALREAKDTLNRPPEQIKGEIQEEKDRLRLQGRVTAAGRLTPRPFKEPVGVVGKEPADPDVKQKRDKIKEVSSPGVTSDSTRSAAIRVLPCHYGHGTMCRHWLIVHDSASPCRALEGLQVIMSQCWCLSD